MKNVFNTPQHYREIIINNFKTKIVKEKFVGKGIACVFLTRFCPVSCDFCFFKSLPQNSKKDNRDAFNSIGMQNLINFINEANLAYLLVSGGGDPFTEFDSLLELIRKTKVDKIVVVTSGYWAKNKIQTENYLTKLNNVIEKKEVILRLSYDEYHVSKLGKSIITNIVSVFANNYNNCKNFKLRIHTMIDDKEIEKFMESIHGDILKKEVVELNNDSQIVTKRNPYDYKLTLKNGFHFEIGFANRFFPNGKVDIYDTSIIKRNLEVFERDMKYSEEYNSSVTVNADNSKGLDFWINYNGNVCTWGNQVPDNIKNIYFDTYEEVVNAVLSDPVMASYIEKGSIYRNNIISEVSPLTVLKSKLINIRDYIGAILFEESKICLYYCLRVLQDFYKENRIAEKEFLRLPLVLQKLIKEEKEKLQEMYQQSKYSIIDQCLENNPSKNELLKLLELIKLGHYEVDISEVDELIKKVNLMYNTSITAITDVSLSMIDPYDKRLNPTKK